ncbi:MAG: hypothetical protein HZA35_01825 [Parcubacteria group bacterium]|nr:hypothetical protein [Parcubacteria group bacterium]
MEARGESSEFNGTVRSFFETGCEGVMWVFIEDGKHGYAAIHDIEDGDMLSIYNEDGSVAFEGKIVSDWEIGYAEYPMNPGHGQPTALGYWIHWTQKGWTPDDWARLFIREDGKQLRARYTRKKLR